jgi:hypothetical protein
MNTPIGRLKGWGGYSAPETRGEDLERLTATATLSRGLSRSYGDASLPPPAFARVTSRALALL